MSTVGDKLLGALPTVKLADLLEFTFKRDIAEKLKAQKDEVFRDPLIMYAYYWADKAPENTFDAWPLDKKTLMLIFDDLGIIWEGEGTVKPLGPRLLSMTITMCDGCPWEHYECSTYSCDHPKGGFETAAGYIHPDCPLSAAPVLDDEI